jgi:hypothetical protein
MQPAKKAARQMESLIKIIIYPAASRSLLDYPAVGDNKTNL